MAELRLQELVVENFRSIAGQLTVPLDGAITLIHGANGAGKTSLLSAIELSATGRVGFLEDQTGDARALLRNDNYPHGRVRLSIADERKGTRLGSFELNGNQVTGNPALSATEQTYFLERGFLPQTALGHLLESYTETSRQVDTALVRFVKSLVGLDELDALIDGLHASGDERRTRRVVAWSRAHERRIEMRRRRDEAERSRQSAQGDLDAGIAKLRGFSKDSPAATEVQELLRESLERGRGSETARADLAGLEELRARMDALVSLTGTPGQWDSLVTKHEAARAADAQRAYESWAAGPGTRTLKELNRVRVESLRLPLTDLPQLTTAYAQAMNAAVEAVRSRANSVAANEDRVANIARLDRLVSITDEEIHKLEQQAKSIPVPADVRVLIDILRLSIPVAKTENCPLCDERYTGVGTLSQHLSEKLHRLSDGARELVALEQELESTRADRANIAREVVLLRSLPLAEVSEPLDWVIRLLNGLSDEVDEGSRLHQAMKASQSRTAELAAAEAERSVVSHRLEEISRFLHVDIDKLSFAEANELLRREIAARTQRLQSSEIRRRREREIREAIEDSQKELQKWLDEIDLVENELLSLNSKIALAESRMKAARGVLRDAETTRSRLINEVFDQSLNGLWAQLFCRFAPSERYVPRFVKQTEASRSVDVRLETALPDGRTSGSPGAMLSYGNANSAALALFMALHLSAPTQLPWLIFDDPVQSMDDIHVANFAAIVRQLAYVHRRQVVIAIHQPELFDYLALELAPSTPQNSLVRVTLDRGSGITEARVDRIVYSEEPSLQHAI